MRGQKEQGGRLSSESVHWRAYSPYHLSPLQAAAQQVVVDEGKPPGAHRLIQREVFDTSLRDDRIETLAFKVGVDHDNRDFRLNPVRGQRLQAYLTHDPGRLARAREWTFWEVEASKYFSLGESAWFRQRVLALGLATGDTGSGRAPYFSGARLGGYYHLRGFESHRFNDMAMLSYAAELRLMSRWHPVRHLDFLGGIDIDWFQLVLFGEAGRVAPSAYGRSSLRSPGDWS